MLGHAAYDGEIPNFERKKTDGKCTTIKGCPMHSSELRLHLNCAFNRSFFTWSTKYIFVFISYITHIYIYIYMYVMRTKLHEYI